MLNRVLRKRSGAVVKYGGQHHRGWLRPNATIPEPTPTRTAILDLSVSEVDGGYILEWQSRTTSDSSDSWHLSLDEALDAARHWFGIKPDEWVVVAEPSN